MTAEDPPPAPDWPASCGAAAAREGGGAEQGADCLPAPPASFAPPRPQRKHGEPILAPREPGSRRRMEHAQQGPARRGRAGAPQAGAGGAGGGSARSGRRSPIPAAWRVRAQPGTGGRAGAGPGSLRHRGGRMGDAAGTQSWAHISLFPFLNGGVKMQRWASTRSPRPEM